MPFFYVDPKNRLTPLQKLIFFCSDLRYSTKFSKIREDFLGHTDSRKNYNKIVRTFAWTLPWWKAGRHSTVSLIWVDQISWSLRISEAKLWSQIFTKIIYFVLDLESILFRFLQKLTDDTIMQLIFGDGTKKERFFDEMYRALRAKKRSTEKIFSIVAAIFAWSRSTINAVNASLQTTNAYFNGCLFNSLAEYVKERRKEMTRISRDKSFKSYLDHLLESSEHPCGESLHADGSDDGSEFHNSEQKVRDIELQKTVQVSSKNSYPTMDN